MNLEIILFLTHPDRVARGDLEVFARAVSAPGPGSRVVAGAGSERQPGAAPGEAPRHGVEARAPAPPGLAPL